MRKVFLILALTMGVALHFAAIQDEKGGLRGIKWGDPPPPHLVVVIEALPEEELWSTSYENPSENLVFQSVPITKIWYGFIGNQFVSAQIDFAGSVTVEQAKKALEAKWGVANKDYKALKDSTGQVSYFGWTGSLVEISLKRLKEGYLIAGVNCPSIYDKAEKAAATAYAKSRPATTSAPSSTPPTASEAMKDEEEGYRGVKWGSSPPKGLIAQEAWVDQNTASYSKPDEDLTFQSYPVSRVKYYFYRCRFYQVVITFNKSATVSEAKKAAETRWGKPRGDLNGRRQGTDTEYNTWYGDRVSAELLADSSGVAFLRLQCTEITNELLAAIAKASPSSAQTTISAQAPSFTPQGPQHPPLEIRVNPRDGLEYVWIPAGTFKMGCPSAAKDCGDHTSPQHWVTITKGLWICRTPTTWAAWDKFSKEAGKPPSGKATDLLLDPVDGVTWNDASAYCKWAGGRLPSEAEWEYSARGGKESKLYPWGDEPPVCNPSAPNGAAWHCGFYPINVGCFQANGYKLYDMAGNVAQWVADWAPAQAPDPCTPQIDPKGPDLGKEKVHRGGGALPDMKCLQVHWTSEDAPDKRYDNVGFRCVCDDIQGQVVSGQGQRTTKWLDPTFIKAEKARRAQNELKAIERDIASEVKNYNNAMGRNDIGSATLNKMELLKLQQRYYANLPGDAPDRIPPYNDMQDRLEIPYDCRQPM